MCHVIINAQQAQINALERHPAHPSLAPQGISLIGMFCCNKTIRNIVKRNLEDSLLVGARQKKGTRESVPWLGFLSIWIASVHHFRRSACDLRGSSVKFAQNQLRLLHLLHLGMNAVVIEVEQHLQGTYWLVE